MLSKLILNRLLITLVFFIFIISLGLIGVSAEGKSGKAAIIQNKIGKEGISVDNLLNTFANKHKNLSIKERKEKYEIIVGKTYNSIERVKKSSLSKTKRELFGYVLKYLLVQAEEKIGELEFQLKGEEEEDE